MVEDQYKLCMQLCQACSDTCIACAAACENEASPMMKTCISLNMDCAEFCRLTASYLGRNSEFSELVCQDCAEICTACAEECVNHQADHCIQCAQACRACAEECLKVGITHV
jgi:hypothetical protein